MMWLRVWSGLQATWKPQGGSESRTSNPGAKQCLLCRSASEGLCTVIGISLGRLECGVHAKYTVTHVTVTQMRQFPTRGMTHSVDSPHSGGLPCLYINPLPFVSTTCTNLGDLFMTASGTQAYIIHDSGEASCMERILMYLNNVGV